MYGKNNIPQVFKWEEAIPRFSHCKKSLIKSRLFQQGYLELTRRICTYYLKDRNCNMLKTDLWNEGVEYDRDILTEASKIRIKKRLFAMDVSPKICSLAKKRLNNRVEVEIVCASLTNPPFKNQSFDFILDISTIDHLPAEKTNLVIKGYRSVLKDWGALLLIFDSGLNFAMEMYHRFYLRKIYPEWTLVPSKMRTLLQILGFDILEEYSSYLVGLMGGTHSRLPIIGRFLDTRIGIIRSLIRKIELSKWSKHLCFIAPQYAIIAKKREYGK